MMRLTKQEFKDLNAYGWDVKKIINKPQGKIISSLVVISHGRRELHDSGFPYIKVIGLGSDKLFYNLGWHDHFICNSPINIDSFGKNIFHVMAWSNNQQFRVSENFISCSTFEIGTRYCPDDEFIVLR